MYIVDGLTMYTTCTHHHKTVKALNFSQYRRNNFLCHCRKLHTRIILKIINLIKGVGIDHRNKK